MKEQILVDNETKEFLRKSFGCSLQAVWRALRFDRSTEAAKRIRVLAMKRGGKIVGGHVPYCDTEHDAENGIIRVYFSSRVVAVINRNNNDVAVEVDGKVETVYHNMTLAEYNRLWPKLEMKAVTL